MRFIKRYKTFELKDETYLSAADRLEGLHPRRARALRKYVDDRQSVDIDYIDPRPLLATGQGLYYITKVEVRPNTMVDGNDILVDLESVNEKVYLVIPNYDTDRLMGWRYNTTQWKTPWGMVPVDKKIKSGNSAVDHKTEPFWFLNRKTARLFMDIVEKEAGEKLLFSINDIYMS